MNEKNYNIIEDRIYKKPPSWYTKNGPTIFYYSAANLKLAKQMAEDLESLLNMEFDIRIGAGTNVKDSERVVKFNIHLI